MNQDNANAAVELTSISFHRQTVVQSMIVTLGVILFIILGYIALRYMGMCGGLGEIMVRHRWSMRWSTTEEPHQAPKYNV